MLCVALSVAVSLLQDVMNALIPPIVERYQRMADDDTELLALLEVRATCASCTLTFHDTFFALAQILENLLHAIHRGLLRLYHGLRDRLRQSPQNFCKTARSKGFMKDF